MIPNHFQNYSTCNVIDMLLLIKRTAQTKFRIAKSFAWSEDVSEYLLKFGVRAGWLEEFPGAEDKTKFYYCLTMNGTMFLNNRYEQKKYNLLDY